MLPIAYGRSFARASSSCVRKGASIPRTSAASAALENRSRSSARSIVAPAEIVPRLAAVPELVLGRRRRRGDEVALAVVHEPVETELGGAAQHRIRLVAQPGEVAAVQVVLVEVLRQPRSGHRPRRPDRVAVAEVADHAPSDARCRSCGAPSSRACRTSIDAVRVPVTDRSRMNARSGSCSSARLADLRRPVVHLGVDVDRVVRAPRRPHVLVPDALQVGGLRAGPARRDQQVAAVLEEQLDETGIRSAARGDPPIGRQILGRRRPAAPASGDRTARDGRRRGRRAGRATRSRERRRSAARRSGRGRGRRGPDPCRSR